MSSHQCAGQNRNMTMTNKSLENVTVEDFGTMVP